MIVFCGCINNIIIVGERLSTIRRFSQCYSGSVGVVARSRAAVQVMTTEEQHPASSMGWDTSPINLIVTL